MPSKIYRNNCPTCRRPVSLCYCALIKKIESPIHFVILIHPLENKRKIATGRMAHLCLANSSLISGHDFTDNKDVNKIIDNPNNHCVLLYPGKDALDLSSKKTGEQNFFPPKKKLVVFVVDGTWNTAKKTVRLSENLKKLPTICFTPTTPSQFRIRKQPNPRCYSTIEAIHHILDYFDLSEDRDGERPHDLLLTLFNRMVEQQIEFLPTWAKKNL